MSQLLRDGIFWVAVACCVVASLAIVRATIAVGEGAGAASRPRRAVEIAYAVVPAIFLGVVLVATWRLMRGDDRPDPRPAPDASSAAAAPAPR